MNVNSYTPVLPPTVTPVENLPTPQTNPDTRAAADTYWSGVDNLPGRSSRWIDKDGNGKIDIEVDFSAGPGSYFRKLGLTGHSALSAEQKQELIDQMIEISLETNLVFHDKGSLEKPDGTINFGNFAPVPSNGKNLVQVNFPENTNAPYTADKPDEPAEAYIRGDARNLKANSRNRGGHALAHALLHALGLPHPNPDEKSNAPANPTDSLGYSLLSTVPETATGHDFHGSYVTRSQLHDMGALTLRYGINSERRNQSSETDYDANTILQSGMPVTMTIASGDGEETLLADKDTHDQSINLNHGTFSSIGGFTNNVAIARGAHIENVVTGSGTNKIIASTVANSIVLGSGKNTVIFNNSWDSTPRDIDVIHHFKSGSDKIDISGFSQKLYNGTLTGGTPHLDIQKTANGASYVRYWSVYNPADPSEPDFKVRADGVQMSDIITKK